MNIRSNPDTTLPAVTTGPLPASRKIFVTPDEAPDLRVPLREIILREGAGEPEADGEQVVHLGHLTGDRRPGQSAAPRLVGAGGGC